ncbi:hypothetical protein [Halanaerobium congolense]|nr:hypothetical protein [Halanaerobium congolense]
MLSGRFLKIMKFKQVADEQKKDIGNGFYMDDYVFKLRLIKQETTDL